MHILKKPLKKRDILEHSSLQSSFVYDIIGFGVRTRADYMPGRCTSKKHKKDKKGLDKHDRQNKFFQEAGSRKQEAGSISLFFLNIH